MVPLTWLFAALVLSVLQSCGVAVEVQRPKGRAAKAVAEGLLRREQGGARPAALAQLASEPGAPRAPQRADEGEDLNAASESAPEDALAAGAGGASESAPEEAEEQAVEDSKIESTEIRAQADPADDSKHVQLHRKHGNHSHSNSSHHHNSSNSSTSSNASSTKNGSKPFKGGHHVTEEDEVTTTVTTTTSSTLPVNVTAKYIAANASKHTEGMINFVDNIRKKLDDYCEHGECQAILNKLTNYVRKSERRQARWNWKMVPTLAPPLDPSKMREAAAWTLNITSMDHRTWGESPLSKLPINKVKCLGEHCGIIQVHYLEQRLDLTDRGKMTPWFSEKGTGQAHCPFGTAVSQIQCRGLFCGQLRLRCQKPNYTIWQTDDTATEEKGYFNELAPGIGGCSPGYTLYGMKCAGEYCHSKALLCKGTKPPARDCVLGPWSEWSACTGMCTSSVQTRQRKVFLDERWGGRCWGPREHKRRCVMRECVEAGLE